MSEVTLDVMTFTDLKFTLEKRRKGEFDVSRHDVERAITTLIKK